jgi:predicted NUDIX family NTP pyrophosphohydrolase
MLQVLLVHFGGPYWAGKDVGAWSIPKGEYSDMEEPLDAARREFHEETGVSVMPPFLPLGSVKQTGGKIVTIWAVGGDCDPSTIVSNTFVMEWPRKSGKFQEFPEVDQARWFSLPAARAQILPSQRPFLDALAEQIAI